MSQRYEPPPIAGQNGYDRTRALLSERGFAETPGRPYTGSSFGSWIIGVAHDPPLAIVWDGRERWSIIRAFDPNTTTAWGYSDFYDLWIGKRPEDHTPDAVVGAVDRIHRFAVQARRSM